MSGSLMIVGATSGAGKSTVSAALCRVWARSGKDVAPFKAQNMSNHAAVTPDGGEIGRAQALQAFAARVETDRRMNPVLLKPASCGRSYVVVLGDEHGATDARAYRQRAISLRPVVLTALSSLRAEHDWVVLEGAGGAAEINLLDRDLVNLPLAAAAAVPAVLVVDIDHGGAFAAAYGTICVVPQRLREQIVGIVFNSFRGDPSLLDSGIEELTRRTGVPVLGVLPHLGDEPMLGVEDSLDITAKDTASRTVSASSESQAPVRVAVLQLPHLANPSDLDPLIVEPDAVVRWVSTPGDLAEADLVIIPGSRATVNDLKWLRERGLDRALRDTSATILGICGGYQMLGTVIVDDLESGAGIVEGLGLLEVQTLFEAPKIVQRSTGTVGGFPVAGYQIRWGRPHSGTRPWLNLDGGEEGAISGDGRVRGTSLHGLLDSDGFRGDLLSTVAAARGREFTLGSMPYADVLDRHVDRLADWLTEYGDVDRLTALARTAVAAGNEPGWEPVDTVTAR